MKITTYCRIDIKTGEVLEERSFEYTGPLSMCGRDPGNDGYGDQGSDGSMGTGGDAGSGGSERDDPRNNDRYKDQGEDATLGTGTGHLTGHEAGGLGISGYTTGTKIMAALETSVRSIADFAATLVGRAIDAAIASTGIGSLAQLGSLAFTKKTLTQNLANKLKAGTKINEAIDQVFAESNLPDDMKAQVKNSLNTMKTNDTSGIFSGSYDSAGRFSPGQESGTGSRDHYMGFTKPGDTTAAATGVKKDADGNIVFDSFEDALTYITGQSAQQSGEAWDFYKEFVQPYTAEFYTQARELIGPNMEYAKNFLEAQNALLPMRRDAAEMGLNELMANIERSSPVSEKFYASAGNIDPDQRADEAQATIQSAVKNADSQIRRQAGRVGLSGRYGDALKTTGLDLARLIAGARTKAKADARKEKFSQLAQAVNLSNMQTGGSTSALPLKNADGTTGANLTQNPASLATTFSGQAANAANAGFGNNLTEKNIEYNKPYNPSIWDNIGNAALYSVARTDWSDVF